MKKVGIDFRIYLIFIIFGMLIYSNVIGSFFLSDDFTIINAVSKNGPFAIWAGPGARFFRPLFSLSMFISYRLWGLNPIGYHFTNILIHSLNSFLVFLISFSLLDKIAKRRLMLSVFSGLLFLISPNHSESVAWISAGVDLIITFFCLSSFFAYLIYKRYDKAIYFLTSVLLFMCALFTKESAVIYPFIIIAYEAYDYIRDAGIGHRPVRIISASLAYFAPLLLYLPIRYKMIGALIGGYGNNVHLAFSIKTTLRSLISNCARAFLPAMHMKAIAVFFTASAALLIIICIAKGRAPRAGRPLLNMQCFLTSSLVISTLPVINLSPSLLSTQGERFVYLPSVFASLLFILLLDSMIYSKKFFVASFISLSLISGILLYNLNENWREAGEISKSILDCMGKMRRANRLFVINLPDSIDGAYIFRNGISDAVNLFNNPGRSADIIVVSYNKIFKRDNATMVTRRSNIFYVQLSNPKTFFMNANRKIESTFVAEHFKILNFKKHAYELRFNDFNSDDKLLFYSAGKMENFSFL